MTLFVLTSKIRVLFKYVYYSTKTLMVFIFGSFTIYTLKMLIKIRKT